VKINMLPAECLLDVDFRLPVGFPRARLLEAAQAIVARYPAVSCEELLAGGPEANFSDPTHEMVGHLVRNAAGRLGYEPKPIVSLGGTDTRFWRVAGVPAFVYGCSPAGMGGIDESVSIAEFHHVLSVHALSAWDYLTGGRRPPQAAKKMLPIPTSGSEGSPLRPSPSGPAGHLPRLRGRKSCLTAPPARRR